MQHPSLFVISVLCEKAKSISHDALSIRLPEPVDTGGDRSSASLKSLHCQFPTVSTTKETQHTHIQCVKVAMQDCASLLGHCDGVFCSS